MGGLVHESAALVFFISAIWPMSDAIIGFLFDPRAPVAPDPNDLWPRDPRAAALNGAD